MIVGLVKYPDLVLVFNVVETVLDWRKQKSTCVHSLKSGPHRPWAICIWTVVSLCNYSK